MEALGAAAAIVELGGLSIKATKAVRSLAQSFKNAPTQLVQLASRLDHLHLLITQTRCLFAELSASESLDLLPPEHQVMLSTCLQSNFNTLETVQSLCSVATATSERFGTRVRWAALDKKKADRILEQVAKAESELNTVLAILGVQVSAMSYFPSCKGLPQHRRLSNHNRVSLEVLNTSYALLHRDLRESTENVRAMMHTEIQTLIKSVPQVPTDASENIKVRANAKIPMQVTQRSIRSSESISKVHPIPIVSSSKKVEDVVDPGWRLIEHDMRKSLLQYSVALGNHRDATASNTTQALYGGLLAIQIKRNRRKIKMVFEIGFNIFCQHILQFELKAQQATWQWTGMPRFDFSVTVFNVRPIDSPIFEACREKNLLQVRYLLESGQASIYDVNDEIGGLLEHAVQSGDGSYWFTRDQAELRRIQDLVGYLLQEGCDPNIYYGAVTKDRLPAALLVFDRAYTTLFATMLANRADITSYGSILGGCLHGWNDGLEWKARMLRDMGFSDWSTKSYVMSDNLLLGACQAGHLKETMFALEIAGIDPNSQSGWGSVLEQAASSDFVKGATLLIQVGAEVNHKPTPESRTALSSSLWGAKHIKDMAHFLLFHGADPRLGRTLGSSWAESWACGMHEMRITWWYNDLEGGLAHLLLHGSDPFETCSFPRMNAHRHRDIYYFRATEFARSWSYCLNSTSRSDENPLAHEEWQDWLSWFDRAEEMRENHHDIIWSKFGAVSRGRARENGVSDCVSSSSTNTEGRAPCHTYQAASIKQVLEENSPIDAIENVPHDSTTCSSDSDDDEFPAEMEPERTFFQGQTQFYHHIKSADGRRKLSRFPKVLALCDALCFAGYRADMDDEGDIWYEIGDGDQYFDAREYQPAEDLDNNDLAFCPICQDFERHGLGHILQEMEEAKREFQEYKDRVKARKQSWF